MGRRMFWDPAYKRRFGACKDGCWQNKRKGFRPFAFHNNTCTWYSMKFFPLKQFPLLLFRRTIDMETKGICIFHTVWLSARSQGITQKMSDATCDPLLPAKQMPRRWPYSTVAVSRRRCCKVICNPILWRNQGMAPAEISLPRQSVPRLPLHLYNVIKNGDLRKADPF